MSRFRIVVVALLFLAPQLVQGQRASSVLAPGVGGRWRAVAGDGFQDSGRSAFLIEAVGATAGSLAGFGAIYLFKNDCDSEDLECILETGGLALVTSTVGAAVGAMLAGNRGDTAPSGWGAVLGAIAGSAAGIGTWHLFTEEINVSNSPAFAIGTYALTQGIVTAIGSRIGRALKSK